jgi:hypothetical protein
MYHILELGNLGQHVNELTQLHLKLNLIYTQQELRPVKTWPLGKHLGTVTKMVSSKKPK